MCPPFKWLDITSPDTPLGRCYGNATVTPLGCRRRGANVPPATEMSFAGRYAVRLLRALVCLVVLALVATGTAWAQAVAGSQLSGVVKD